MKKANSLDPGKMLDSTMIISKIKYNEKTSKYFFFTFEVGLFQLVKNERYNALYVFDRKL